MSNETKKYVITNKQFNDLIKWINSHAPKDIQIEYMKHGISFQTSDGNDFEIYPEQSVQAATKQTDLKCWLSPICSFHAIK